MKCHGNNQEKQGKHKHSSLKHMLHMIICCGLPIIIIALVPFIARYNSGLSKIMFVIAPFICPLMMGGMFFAMFRSGKKGSCCSNKENQIESKEPNKF